MNDSDCVLITHAQRFSFDQNIESNDRLKEESKNSLKKKETIKLKLVLFFRLWCFFYLYTIKKRDSKRAKKETE